VVIRLDNQKPRQWIVFEREHRKKGFVIEKSLLEFIELAIKPALEQEFMEVKWKFYKFIDFGTSIYSPKKFMEHLWCSVRYWKTWNMDA
jgi:hypothetical protein